jgi:hypothetical protein
VIRNSEVKMSYNDMLRRIKEDIRAGLDMLGEPEMVCSDLGAVYGDDNELIIITRAGRFVMRLEPLDKITTYELDTGVEDEPIIICLLCEGESSDPSHIADKYCGVCNIFHENLAKHLQDQEGRGDSPAEESEEEEED